MKTSEEIRMAALESCSTEKEIEAFSEGYDAGVRDCGDRYSRAEVANVLHRLIVAFNKKEYTYQFDGSGVTMDRIFPIGEFIEENLKPKK